MTRIHTLADFDAGIESIIKRDGAQHYLQWRIIGHTGEPLITEDLRMVMEVHAFPKQILRPVGQETREQVVAYIEFNDEAAALESLKQFQTILKPYEIDDWSGWYQLSIYKLRKILHDEPL